MPYLIVFGLEFEKAIFIFVWNYYYRVSQNVKVHERQKIFEFRTKNYHICGTFRPYFERTIVISELTAFEIVKMQSFMLREKDLSFQLKRSYLRLFGLEFEETTVTVSISNFEFIKNEFLTITVNFGIRFIFFYKTRVRFLWRSMSVSGSSL